MKVVQKPDKGGCGNKNGALIELKIQNSYYYLMQYEPKQSNDIFIILGSFTPKGVTSGKAHHCSLAPGSQRNRSEETRSGGDTASNLAGPGIESQISGTASGVSNHNVNRQFFAH